MVEKGMYDYVYVYEFEGDLRSESPPSKRRRILSGSGRKPVIPTSSSRKTGRLS